MNAYENYIYFGNQDKDIIVLNKNTGGTMKVRAVNSAQAKAKFMHIGNIDHLEFIEID